MKEFFISDCCKHENKVITSSFVVASKQVKAKKNGEPYLALVLADRSGQIEAKMWDNVEEFLDTFEQDDFLKVKGLINKYKNRFQLTIHKLRRMQETEIDFADYLPKIPPETICVFTEAEMPGERTTVPSVGGWAAWPRPGVHLCRVKDWARP